MEIEDNSTRSINQTLNTPVLNAAADCFKKPDAAEDTLITGGSATWQDFLATFIQWGRKLLNIAPNREDHQGETTGADDTPNRHNPFYQLIYNKDGNPESGLNHTGMGFLFGSVVGGFIIGVTLKIIHNLRKLELDSYHYAQKQAAKILRKINLMRKQPINDVASLKPAKEDIEDIFNSILETNKMSKLYTNTNKSGNSYTYYYTYQAKKTNSSAIVLEQTRTLVQNITPPPADEKLASYTKPNMFVRGINWLQHSTVGEAMQAIWKRISKYSFIYWLVSLPVLVVFGSLGLPVLLPALITTLGIGLAFAAWKAKNHIQTIHQAVTQPKIEDVEEQIDTTETDKYDQKRVLAELKQRYFEKTAHKATMSVLTEHEKEQQKNSRPLRAQAIKKSPSSDYLALVTAQQAEIGDANEANVVFNKNNADVAAVLNSDLAQRLLGSKSERRARWLVTGLRAAIGAFVEFAFVIGFGADLARGMTAAGGVLANIFTPISSFLGGSLFMAAGGLAMGVIFGVKTLAEVHQQQLTAEEKVYQALTAPYKVKSGAVLANGKPEYIASNMTLGLKIQQLEKSIKEKIVRIEAAKATLSSEQLRNLPNYKLDNINAFSHDRFEKQREVVPFKTKCKKVMSGLFTALTGGQTGVLITRLLFLTGCVFAGALVGSGIGAPLAFGLIAIGFAVVVGGLKLTQSILDKRNSSRESCVDTLDSRISYLKKKDKELTKLEQIVNNESQPDLEPVIGNEMAINELGSEQSSPIPIIPIRPDKVVKSDASPYSSRNSSTHFQSVGSANSAQGTMDIPEEQGVLSFKS